ncbi:PREDICTED: uncharacterized protein LOC108373271 [Rhagoletis zephyria]|uniref:uncharacterized protein LOC108373271 n=1 Tax=Rhagoletis zephyria TaxID=28612 RepID=UPI0008116D6D|nr:PREDICTED: uncharacterized protein LOC108373271 [Rhagoletis zephyria]
MTSDERYESARIHQYCINCLATSHSTGACNSADSCHRCGKAHHTLLHRSTTSPPERNRRDDSSKLVRRRRPSLASRVVKKPAKQTQGGRNLAHRRIRELFHLAPVQAGRHVEDMGNLIDFND